MEERDYQLWLCHIKDMWHKKMRMLINYYGSAREVFLASEKSLRYMLSLQRRGISEEDIYSIISSKTEMEKNVFLINENMEKKGIGFTYFEHNTFPERLKVIDNPPMVLFYKGRLPENDRKALGIVGARVCTEYGKNVAKKLAMETADMGFNIISGMARGIDACAHWGCLATNGSTYAVLGCGVDVCYPKENIELYENIKKNGGIISEYVPGTKALAYQFPERNRIISALSDGVIMVEAKEKSGSFITIDHALSQNKLIYAVPGRITDPLSIGCNKLITEGAVPLVDSNQIAADFYIQKENDNKKYENGLEKEFEVLYSCLDLLPISVDEISARIDMPIAEIHEKMLYLQLKGLVYESSKGKYVKKI